MCLVVLAVLPFTAPFSTCDLNGAALVSVLDEIGNDPAGVDDASAAALPLALEAMTAILLLEIHGRRSNDLHTVSAPPSAVPLRL